MNISKLNFVAYTREFLLKSWTWLNDAEIKALTLTPDFTKEQQELFYISLPSRKDYHIWGIKFAGQPIGACGLKHITDTDAEYWGYIGERSYWGKGLGSQMIAYCEKMARTISLKELYLYVGVSNIRARRLYKKCGFVEDGMLSDQKILKCKRILSAV